ncbi:MAG: putative bifunctional diguanylate cyclase/phosphodiesterase [Candidatus Velthaea sp.]
MLHALRGGTVDTAHASALVRLASETRLPLDAHLTAILRESIATVHATCASVETAEGERFAVESDALAPENGAAALSEHTQYARNAIAGKTVLAGETAWPGRFVLAVPIETKDGWRALCVSGDRAFDRDAVAFVRVAGDVLARILEREPAEAAAEAVHRDPLTKLPNRDSTFSRIEQALYSATRHSTRIAILYIDLDGFKAVNDQHGHAVGDAALIEMTRRMTQALRRDEFIGRLGGDEFAAVLPNVATLDEVLSAAERLGKRLADPVDVDDVSIALSASVGIAMFPDDGDNAETLLAHADAAMYEAKREGRGTIRLFGENVASEMRSRRDLRDRLRAASVERDFLLCFQPVVHVPTGRVVAAEALVRWIHPSRGLLSPRSFFAMAETMRLCALLDCWVVGNALRSMHQWSTVGLNPYVNVNVSAPAGEIVDELRRLRRDENLDPSRLRVEMAERTALLNIEATSQFFGELRRLGARTGLDGFAAGPTSLRMLATAPIDYIKLDRSLTIGVGVDEDGDKLATIAISLANAFRITVAADSVESPEQLAWLQANGVHEIQGYGIAQPMIAPDFQHWWEKRGASIAV